jgi:hypothetical protein
MMRRTIWLLVGLVLAMSVAACACTSQIDREPVSSRDPLVSLLRKGIAQLNINIDALSNRMSDVRKASARTDPALQELQALDLSGWQLHQQQWVLQRNHLVLARDLLQQASKNESEKRQLQATWRKHRQEYVQAIEELRQQRQNLESQHVEVEARLIELRLQ